MSKVPGPGSVSLKVAEKGPIRLALWRYSNSMQFASELVAVSFRPATVLY